MSETCFLELQVFSKRLKKAFGKKSLEIFYNDCETFLIVYFTCCSPLLELTLKMPLIIKDYSWTQTESTVYINVPLKGTKAAKVDVVSTDEYLKVTSLFMADT